MTRPAAEPTSKSVRDVILGSRRARRRQVEFPAPAPRLSGAETRAFARRSAPGREIIDCAPLGERIRSPHRSKYYLRLNTNDKHTEIRLETVQFETIQKLRTSPGSSAPSRRRFRRASRLPGKMFAPRAETPCARVRFAQIITLPNTHVPVVACRSAGIWTRGQSTALGRPAAGGEPANPAQRGTRLEATTDRAFLVSAGSPNAGAQRGLSILPGVRTGNFLVQTMALIALALCAAQVRLGHGVAADRVKRSVDGF